tara:strand:+ start:105 stop:452 length:348 start_codon:yes stop_codon:yes gene_type:complete
MNNNVYPKLIEPGVKYFINETLHQCKNFKNKYYNFIYNLGIFLFFILILFSILYFKYKGKMTKEEKQLNIKKKQEFILSKLKLLNSVSTNNNLYTDLPLWSNNPEVQMLNKKIFC